MRLFILILLIHIGRPLVAQESYKINYPERTTVQINHESIDGKEKVYNVDFLNEQGQKIKSIVREKACDHGSKADYKIRESITYYFYEDSLLVSEISIGFKAKYLTRTDYAFNTNKKSLGWTCYSLLPRITKDSFKRLIEKDVLLNSPILFPYSSAFIVSKEVRDYESDRLVYKCYFEKFGELKTAVPAREQFFIYDREGRLTEHISNPKSPAGGTAFLRTVFEYNDKNQVIKEVSFSDGRIHTTTDIQYTDTTITKNIEFHTASGSNPRRKNATWTRIYKKESDGYFYDNSIFRKKFAHGTNTD